MPRNILLVTVDSLRADHVGCYGYDRDTTPNLDARAPYAHRFTNAFAHACATQKSFPTILTSSYPQMYGGFERVSDHRTVVAEPLQSAGYHTGAFHSNLFLAADFGYGRGFDTYFDSRDTPSIPARIRQFVKDNISQDNPIYRLLKTAFDATERHAGVEIGSAYEKANRLTDMAIEWIEATETDDPNFLWTHYMDVHHPYIPPEDHQLEFRQSPIGDREAIQLRRKMLEHPDEITDSELQDLIDLYDAEIRFTDTHIERLIQAAEAQWDDVVVIVTSDHGEEFRDHGKFSHHGTFFDEVIHVPFLLDAPDSEGSVRDDVVGLIDVAPTIVDFGNADQADSFYGESLRDVIDGTREPDTVAGFEFSRTDEWKLIWDGDRELLFNLVTDPDETENVLSQHPDTADQLRQRILTVRELVRETDEDLGEVLIDDDIEQRLEALGYKDRID